MPREKQDALKLEREIRRFLEQSHISTKNVARLRVLASSRNTRIASLAARVLEVAIVTPDRRRRIRTLARQHREVLARMEQAGLILQLPAWGEADPHDVDPIAAWYEWVALRENHHGR
jgi:sugar phosphate isomerase/epimerase